MNDPHDILSLVDGAEQNMETAAFLIGCMALLITEIHLSGNDDHPSEAPDSVPTSLAAFILWVALLSPLVFSYAAA